MEFRDFKCDLMNCTMPVGNFSDCPYWYVTFYEIYFLMSVVIETPVLSV